MKKTIRSFGQIDGLLGLDPLTEAHRRKIREMILALAEAELKELLAAQPYERTGERQGYRHGNSTFDLETHPCRILLHVSQN